MILNFCLLPFQFAFLFVVVSVAHIYPPAYGQHQTLNIGRPRTFHCNDYFVVGGILTCLGVSSGPKFLWISLKFCPQNSLLVRNLHTEIIIVKSFIQARNNVTRVRVERR